MVTLTKLQTNVDMCNSKFKKKVNKKYLIETLIGAEIFNWNKTLI